VTDGGLYSVRDVARIFGLQEARLRYWAQTGFVGPSQRQGGKAMYTFEDLIGVKVAKELLDGGLPLQRVRKNLDALRIALPGVDKPLSQTRIVSDGERVVVVGDEKAFEPESGQLVLSFTVESLTAEVAKILELPARPKREATTYESFLQAVSAEEAGDLARAEQLYRKTLARDDGFAAAWTNLGNVLERSGARGTAREAYEKALGLDPDQPEARFNLANLLADVGELELALAEYRRVVASCPEFADAHYNLGLLWERLGSPASARAAYEQYLELDVDSEWAERARERVSALRIETGG
jgi:tetratricopeptide (TPR) repeat protein